MFKHRQALKAMRKKFGITHLKQFYPETWHHGYAYFTAYMNQQQIFIKADTQFHFLKNDVLAHQILRKDIKTPNLISHFERVNFEALIFEFVPGQLVRDEDILEKPELLTEILSILRTLNQKGIIHRDIKLKNFMLLDQHILIIDFTFAVSLNNMHSFKELDERIKAHRKVLNSIGDGLNPSHWKWNDFFAMRRIIEKLIQSHPELDNARFKELEKHKLQFELAEKNQTYCYAQSS